MMPGLRLLTIASSTSMRLPPLVKTKLSPVTPMSVSMKTSTHATRSLLTPLELSVGFNNGSSTMMVLRSVTRMGCPSSFLPRSATPSCWKHASDVAATAAAGCLAGWHFYLAAFGRYTSPDLQI